MANVKFYTVDLKQKFLDLAQKDSFALYWINETQELYKGSQLFGTGQTASEKAAGLLSAGDYAELQKLISGVALQDAAPGQIPFMGIDGKFSWSNIALRRDNDYNYKKIENTFVPINGEVCLIDVAGYGLRAKVGNGINTLAQLPYTDEAVLYSINSMIVKGYLYQGQFYKDAEHSELLEALTGRIYIDVITSRLYTYSGLEYETVVANLPNATAEIAGLVKLYNTTGQNTDGSMTQKSITDELNEKFEMGVVPEEEMLIFDRDVG